MHFNESELIINTLHWNCLLQMAFNLKKIDCNFTKALATFS